MMIMKQMEMSLKVGFHLGNTGVYPPLFYVYEDFSCVYQVIEQGTPSLVYF